LRSFAIALILILIQANKAPESQPYQSYIQGSDLVVTASMEHAELTATGKEMRWDVTYRVREVLKGSYKEPRLNVSFDSKALAPENRSSRGTEERRTLILFLRAGPEGKLSYAGPPLNSPLTIASRANVALLRQTLAGTQEADVSWFETIVPGWVAGAAIIAGCLVLAAVLIIAITRTMKAPKEKPPV